MIPFNQLLEEALAETGKEVITVKTEQVKEVLTDFFSLFVSAQTADEAMEIYSKESDKGSQIEVSLGIPLNLFLTGTGEHGPLGRPFKIEASPLKTLSWFDESQIRFASFVWNRGMEPKFTEEDIVEAVTDALTGGKDGLYHR